MTRDEIIRMAREAGIVRCTCKSSTCDMLHSAATFAHLASFAALVRADEREACATILDRNAEACNNNSMLRDVLMGNALAIRARGQA